MGNVRFQRFLVSEDGPTAVEYAVMLALIVIVCLAAIQAIGTNANTMVIPGYVTEFTITFPKPGEYLMMCHEYCGTLHHEMVGALIVEEEGA